MGHAAYLMIIQPADDHLVGSKRNAKAECNFEYDPETLVLYSVLCLDILLKNEAWEYW